MRAELIADVISSLGKPLRTSFIPAQRLTSVRQADGKRIEIVEEGKLGDDEVRKIIATALSSLHKGSYVLPPAIDLIEIDRVVKYYEETGQLSSKAINLVDENEHVIVSSTFKIVLLTTVLLTFASGTSAMAMSSIGDEAVRNQQAIFETMNTVWKLGLGAILGLLGGKSA